MEEKYFVVHNSYREIRTGKKEFELINLDYINLLADFATTLERKPEVTEALGYLSALGEYYSKTTDSNEEIFKYLNSSSIGRTFLITNIQLVLLEKKLRRYGTDPRLLKAYGTCLEEYNRSIEMNKLK